MKISQQLTNGYNHLTTVQADDVISKYQATYFLAESDQVLDLPVAYRNSRYVLCRKDST